MFGLAPRACSLSSVRSSPITPTMVETIEFTMTGGVVVVRSDGPPSRAVKLVCPNRDVVTVTVERES
jgi:hypothetical protein